MKQLPLIMIPTLQEAKDICKQVATPFSYSTKKQSGEYNYVFVGYRDAKVTDFDVTTKFNMRELMYIVDKKSQEVVMTHPGHGKFFEEDTICKLSESFRGAYKPEVPHDQIGTTRWFLKLDGTSITSFIHPSSGQLILRTPSSISNDILTEARNLVGENLIAFAKELHTREEPAFMCFEFVSPFNTVVEFYPEPELIVTQIRKYNGEYYSADEFISEMTGLESTDSGVRWNDDYTYSPDMELKVEGYVGSFVNEYGYTSFTKLKTDWFENIHGNRITAMGKINPAWIARSYLNNTLGYLLGYLKEEEYPETIPLVSQIIEEIEVARKAGETDTSIYNRMNDNSLCQFTYHNIVKEWISGSHDMIGNVRTQTYNDITNVMCALDEKLKELKSDIMLMQVSRNECFVDGGNRGSFFERYSGHELSNSIIRQLIVPGKPVKPSDIEDYILNKSKNKSPKKFYDWLYS